MEEWVMLDATHAATVSRALRAEPPSYLRYFHPFDFRQEYVEKVLDRADKDVYVGVFERNDFVGLAMLRGLDDGFDVPSLGMYVSSGYPGRGLGKRLLANALDLCAARGIPTVRLTVYEANTKALSLYREFGFVQRAAETSNLGLILTMTLEVEGAR